MSIKAMDFEFKDGKTLLTGWNHDDGTSEGSGKSAILNSLCWCLFGRLPKDSKIDDVIKEGTKSCHVEVEFEDGRKVKRTRKPNTLSIYIPSVEDYCKAKDMKEMQKVIEGYIGFSFETFCQSVYFPQNYPKKFITATEEEKAKILSEVQDLSEFDRARKVTIERLKTLKEHETHEAATIESTSVHLQSFVNNYKGLEELRDNFNFNKKKELVEIDFLMKGSKADRDELQRKVLSLARAKVEKGVEARLEEINKKLEDLQSKKYRYASEERLQAQIKEQIEANNARSEELMKEKVSPTCPTCGQSMIDTKYYQEHLTADLEKLITENAELNLKYSNIILLNDVTINAAIETLNVEKSKLQDKMDNYEGLMNDLAFSQRELQLLEDNIAMAEARYNKLYEQKPRDILHKIEHASMEIKVVTEDLKRSEFRLENHKKERATYDALKDGFKEVKSYVFQNCLTELNHTANKYVSELFEQPVKIHFYNQEDGENVSKIKVDVTLDGIERPLGLYSGGQFRRIQIAVDLALSDIVASRTSGRINLLIFDEVFKDLSFQSMEKVIDLLGRLNKRIVLIEHNDMVQSVVDQVVKVELKDGTSTLV